MEHLIIFEVINTEYYIMGHFTISQYSNMNEYIYCINLCVGHFMFLLFIHNTTRWNVVMCLSIGTPKNNKFSNVPNGKVIIFRCPKNLAHYSLIIMC